MDLLEIVIRALKGRTTGEIKMLAERAGVSWSTVYKIASGRAANPRWESVSRIGTALGVRPPPLTAAERRRLFKGK